MSYNDRDLKVIVLQKKQPKPVTSPLVNESGQKINSGKNSNGVTINAKKLEEKIDSGDVTAPLTIPKELATRIQQTRTANGMKTQKDLAIKACIPVNDINIMEGGKMILSPENKKKIEKVGRVLGLGKLNFPK